MVTITKETTVTGSPDQSGEVPMIDGGNWPFFVNAPGRRLDPWPALRPAESWRDLDMAR
jgi:hypothetical protein